MRKIIALASAVVVYAAAPALAGGPAKGVIELFTSQGCSSCPPADRTLEGIVNRGGFITLAWHVDYWDYLGWKDTFSTKSATKRQESYNSKLGAGVFTPQFAVNGKHNGLGGEGEGLPVTVNVKNNGGNLSVSAGTGNGSATLYLVSYTNRSTVQIQRGENTGKNVTYRHPVSGMRDIGQWNGNAMTLNVPHSGGDCAVILQRGTNGPIIGAASCN